MRGSPNKTAIHGFGSAMSYGRRYLLLLIFNLAMRHEDNDGNHINPETGRRINPHNSRQAGIRGEWDGMSRTDGRADPGKPFNHDNLISNMQDCGSAVSLQKLWEGGGSVVRPAHG
jgi:hypothetical protein